MSVMLIGRSADKLPQTQERHDDRTGLVNFIAAAGDEAATATFLRQGAFYGFTK